MIHPVEPGFASMETRQDKVADSPEKIADAIQQFETLLIEQMLRSMRGSDSDGWMGTEKDSSAESLMEYAEQEFARVIASNGGFGLAKLLSEGLHQ